jgi:hypothetical protein
MPKALTAQDILLVTLRSQLRIEEARHKAMKDRLAGFPPELMERFKGLFDNNLITLIAVIDEIKLQIKEIEAAS